MIWNKDSYFEYDILYHWYVFTDYDGAQRCRLHILFALITEDLSIDIFLLLLLFLKLYLKYSWFTVLYKFRLCSKVIQLYMYVFFSIMVCHRILNIVSVLYNRIMLFIHPIYCSLHLLIPNSQSFPPLTPWMTFF